MVEVDEVDENIRRKVDEVEVRNFDDHESKNRRIEEYGSKQECGCKQGSKQ